MKEAAHEASFLAQEEADVPLGTHAAPAQTAAEEAHLEGNLVGLRVRRREALSTSDEAGRSPS